MYIRREQWKIGDQVQDKHFKVYGVICSLYNGDINYLAKAHKCDNKTIFIIWFPEWSAHVVKNKKDLIFVEDKENLEWK